MGLCVNMLINCKDFLRLRLETLQVTLKFMSPFSEIFYLAHSLLIPLQSLSSFWRPNITIKANPPLSPYSLFCFHLFTCLHCHTMLSCHPEISPESLFPTMIIKNTYSHPDNDTTPIKQWACDLPGISGSPKAFGFNLSKNLRMQIQCLISACHCIEDPSARDQQRRHRVSACRRETAEGKHTVSLEAFSASGRRSPSDRH